MSKILWMIGRNIPLGHHERYGKAEMESQGVFGGSFFGSFSNPKRLDRVASTIVNGLSQYSVAELLAREWDSLPPQVRMAVTNLANTTSRSGNVNKGIAYLDKLLGGKVRRHDVGQTERVVRTGDDGRLYRDSRRINPAVAGASRAFGIIALPPNYSQMSPAQKRKVQQELAKIRRENHR